MFCGLLCILGSIVVRPAAQLNPTFNDISAAVGYFGLLLVFMGFFIHISLE